MIVDELKQSILLEAFEGKLVEHFLTDKYVEKSLSLIEFQKKQLIEKYQVRSEPEYKVITNGEKLFNIPEHWEWKRIGELGVYKKGPFGSALTKSIFVKKSYNTIKVYEQQNAIKKDIHLGNYYITNEYFESKMKGFEISAGDIIVSCAGTIGESYVIPNNFEKGIINQALMRMTLVEEINKNYFLLYFDFILKKMSNKLSSGSAIKNIPPFEIFKQLVIPLPPIEEQQRIVDKIEELFRKLDDIKPIEDSIQCIKKQISNEMNKSIILSSLKGELTIQKDDEDAQNIINNIEENTKKEVEVIKNNLPFSIPKNWKWIKFGDLVNFTIGKTPPRADITYWSDHEYNWISISDMVDGSYINDTKEYVSQKSFDEIYKTKICKKGTLIMSFKMSVGKCSILNIDAFHHEGIISIYPNTDDKYTEIIKQYLFKILPFMTKYGESKKAIKGTTLNSKSLDKLMIPLPPIEEQQRIVDKIEKLLPLCDDMYKIINM